MPVAPQRRRRACGGALAAAVLGALIGCTASKRGPIELTAEVRRPDQAAVLLIIDGADQRRLHDLLDAGRLPYIERLFVRGGVEIRQTISSLPPITYVNVATILTGCLPARHGVYGNRWFDRATFEFRDYNSAATFRDVNDHLRAATVYEMLADELTVNVQCHTRRGVGATIDNSVSSGLDWAFGAYENVDRRAGAALPRINRIAGNEKAWPAWITFYFPSADEIGHRLGASSERYTHALENIDEQIGRIVDALEAAAPAGKLYFALVTDHNHVVSPPEQRFDLLGWLRAHRSLRIGERPRVDRAGRVKRAWLDEQDVLAIVAADRRAVIHLRGLSGWDAPAGVEDARFFCHPPGVDPHTGRLERVPAVGVVCYRDKDRVYVLSRSGHAAIERRIESGHKQYRLVPPNPRSHESQFNDPLGYNADGGLLAFVRRGWQADRAWLAATADSSYPDFVPQIFEYFQSARSGDVVVFAADDWSFRATNPGGHGSALASDCRVSIFFRGPDLPAGARTGPARLADVTPTLLDLIDRADRLHNLGHVDGVSIAPQLRGVAERTVRN